ncbi:Oidioi.mRNA.OKI2018_I69.XSR.g14628.t1.cds [Oikopleura dioica]|uniref:Oidioi.mRNA.OKI2018_I69.XSR.g14628.t1.cds n=1 Tax=Oikopleura dioica TaxID=34765 RepID=A0ABN7SC60_OIKDI|nr:Oidioi.mRNA.OKI2018_I69.XSR.g14628.t1.cds [Oikopleura dioica]
MSGAYPDVSPPSYEDVMKEKYGSVHQGEAQSCNRESYARVPLFSRQITDPRQLEQRASLPVQQFILSRSTSNSAQPPCPSTNETQDEEGPSQICLFCALLFCLPLGLCAAPLYIMAQRSHERRSPDYPNQKSTFYCMAYFAIILGVMIILPRIIAHIHDADP